MKRIIILALFFLTLTGCAGQITGHVFLDKNANNQRDQDEPTLGKVLYSVTIDGTIYKNGIADESGLVLVPRDEDGDYCINIKSSASSYLDPSTQPVITIPPPSKSLKALADTTQTTQPITETTTTTDTPSNQDKQKKDEKKDEAKKSEPEVPLPGAKSLQGCVRVKGWSSSYAVDIPVSIDMQSSKANIPEPQEMTLSTNEPFDLLIYYPRMCKLLDVQLPSYIVKPQYSTGSSPLLELSKLTPDTSQSIKPYILTDDVLVPVSMKLATVGSIEGETKTFELEPKAICPDDTVLTLPKHKFTVKKGTPLSLSRKISGKVGFGETLTLTSTVKNSAPAEFNKGATLVITLPEFSNVESVGESECRNLIQQVECDVDYIEPSSSVNFTITFKLPEGKSITFDYNSKIQTELKFDDDTESIKEAEIPITIPKPVE